MQLTVCSGQSVGVRNEELKFDFRQKQELLFFNMFWAVLWPKQTPVPYVAGAVFQAIKWPVIEAGLSSPYIANVSYNKTN